MITESPIFLVTLSAYALVVFGIGIWGYRHTKTEEDFLAAGRTIGPWVGGAVLAAGMVSAGTFVGAVGRHYLTGVSWIWIWPGLFVGWWVSAAFVAPKLRRFGALTIADYVGKRFDSEGARTLTAALIIMTYTIMLTAQFQAAGEISMAIFGIAPIYAMLILLGSTIFYTMLGGVRSNSYIEFLHAITMVVGLVLSVPLLLDLVGGVGFLGEYLTSLNPRLTGSWFSWPEVAAVSLAFGLANAAAPYEMTRYYSMRNVATTRHAIGVCLGIQMVVGACIMMLGLGVRGLFPVLPSPDQASSVFASNAMSSLIGSMFLIAMIGAIMSTSNSILIVTGGAFAHDLYGRFLRPAATQRELLLVNRLAVLGLGALPIWFALQRFGDIQTIVVEQAKFIASFFFAPIVIGLNWRRGTKQGAVASMAGGFLACLTWTLTLQRSFPSHRIDAVEVGVVTSALLFVLVSRATPPTPAANLEVFFDGAGEPALGAASQLGPVRSAESGC